MAIPDSSYLFQFFTFIVFLDHFSFPTFHCVLSILIILLFKLSLFRLYLILHISPIFPSCNILDHFSFPIFHRFLSNLFMTILFSTLLLFQLYLTIHISPIFILYIFFGTFSKLSDSFCLWPSNSSCVYSFGYTWLFIYLHCFPFIYYLEYISFHLPILSDSFCLWLSMLLLFRLCLIRAKYLYRSPANKWFHLDAFFIIICSKIQKRTK